VVVLEGNHDQVRNPSEYDALDLLRDLPGLTVVDKPTLLDVWRTGRDDKLRVSEASTAMADEAELQLGCLPYPSPNLLLRDEQTRQLSPGDRNLLIREKMMDVARGLAAQRVEGVPCLLLGHWSVDTAEVGQQSRLMMLGGEFTLNVHELESLGFDGILLGHIHKAQTLGDKRCWIVYCGSPEATSFNEEAEDKFYYLWELNPDLGYGPLPVPVPIETPYRRLVTLSEDDFIRELDDEELLLDAALEESVQGAIVRLEIPAGSTLTIAEAQRAIDAAGAFEARVSKARAETERRRESGVTHGQPLDAQIRAWLEQKPDLQPLTEQIIAEALRIEEALRQAEGGAG